MFGVTLYSDGLQSLESDGILVHQSAALLLHLQLTTAMRRAMVDAGFAELSTLLFGEFRESDAQCRPFTTRYYSEAIHRAARVLPPFMREAFGGA